MVAISVFLSRAKPYLLPKAHFRRYLESIDRFLRIHAAYPFVSSSFGQEHFPVYVFVIISLAHLEQLIFQTPR
jgi:hypothetical protein